MNYEKMKALMEASRDESAAQRKAQVKEFPSRSLRRIGNTWIPYEKNQIAA